MLVDLIKKLSQNLINSENFKTNLRFSLSNALQVVKNKKKKKNLLKKFKYFYYF
jgi:hypothetical protein